MPDLLIELLSEEIPARMQTRASDDLKRLVTDALVQAGLPYEGAKAFATPRRLALAVAGIPARSPDQHEVRRGPRVGSPDAALAGFLRGAGLADIARARVERDPKKGEFYVADIRTPGRSAEDVIAGAMPGIVKNFPWPKSMRWGAASAQPGSLRWVRPLQSIVAIFGPETEEPTVVEFEVDGVRAGNVTRGHRFLAPARFAVRRLDDYAEKLMKAKVVLDPERRRDTILADARNLAFAAGLELVEDAGLLDEVAGLVEWPVVLMGSFDAAFLRVPDEVIRATIRANQKCFVLRTLPPPPAGGSARSAGVGAAPRIAAAATPPTTTATPPDRPAVPAGHPPRAGEGGRLANRFLLTANIEATDGGATIIAGNERVIRARLSDARFFWDHDRKTPLADMARKLDGVTFHEKLGTQGERVARIAALAAEIAPLVGADPALARRAAELAKADLMSGVVGEFPELQGLMGRYYALEQGEDPRVATAIEDHYKPLGPSDRVPTEPVAIAVALADKLDTLVGFWAIEEKPTGSKDPFALRRAALGVIRIVLENGLRVGLVGLVDAHHSRSVASIMAQGTGTRAHMTVGRPGADLLSFFADRLKVQLREQGARHDLVDAVFALGETPAAGTLPPPPGGGSARSAGVGAAPQAAAAGSPPATAAPTRPLRGHPPRSGEGGSPAAQDDLLLIVRRVEALGKFLETDDGKTLLAGYRRAVNIIAIEEKKDGPHAGPIDPKRLAEPAEKALAKAIDAAEREAAKAVAAEDFAAAMAALAKLRAPVDTFFEAVLVNAPDAALRENRLRLLARIRTAVHTVADFSRI